MSKYYLINNDGMDYVKSCIPKNSIKENITTLTKDEIYMLIDWWSFKKLNGWYSDEEENLLKKLQGVLK